jgi:hypothetical protein
MNRYEEVALEYITANPYNYVNTHLAIPGKNGHANNVPDIVVHNIKSNDFFVIEITSSYDIGKLLNKVMDRHSTWYNPIKKMYSAIYPDFEISTVLFIRDDILEKTERYLKKNDITDVKLITLEEASFGWKFDWKNQEDGIHYPLNTLK